MGWTSCSRCGESHWEFFQTRWGKDFVILECSPIGYQHVVLAVKSLLSQQVFGVVVSHRWSKGRRGDMEYSWRDDDESCGPEAIAPENVLRRLTEPACNDYAKAWREKCWAKINRKHVPLKKGDVVTFEEKIEFRNGAIKNEFIVTSTKPLRFNDTYMIRSLKERKHTVMRDGKEVQPTNKKERCMNSREFKFQFDMGQADWSRVDNKPIDWLQENKYVIREHESTFGRNFFVYRLKDSNEYSIVLRTRNTQWNRGGYVALYKHYIITEEGFNRLKRLLVASKLSA